MKNAMLGLVKDAWIQMQLYNTRQEHNADNADSNTMSEYIGSLDNVSEGEFFLGYFLFASADIPCND